MPHHTPTVVCDPFLESVLGAEGARVLGAFLTSAAQPDVGGDEAVSVSRQRLERLAATVGLSLDRTVDVLADCNAKVLHVFGVRLFVFWRLRKMEREPPAGEPRQLSSDSLALAPGGGGLHVVDWRAAASRLAFQAGST